MPLKKLLKIKNVHSKLFTKNSKCNPPYYITHNRTHSTIHITPYLLYSLYFTLFKILQLGHKSQKFSRLNLFLHSLKQRQSWELENPDIGKLGMNCVLTTFLKGTVSWDVPQPFSKNSISLGLCISYEQWLYCTWNLSILRRYSRKTFVRTAVSA